MGLVMGFCGVFWGFLKELARRVLNRHKIGNFRHKSIKILDKVHGFGGLYGVIWGVEKWGVFEEKSREFNEMSSFLGGRKKEVMGVSKSRVGRGFASGFKGFLGFS